MNTRHWMESVLGVMTQPVDVQASLAEFQSRAVARLVEMATQFGGALLADAVGLGKTRTSLQAAVKLRRRAGSALPIVICTRARLTQMWRQTCVASGLTPNDFVVVTHTALSRASVHVQPAVVIVDEAHHFRNPHTNRAKNLATLTCDVPVFLVSATPVVNSVWDLYHVLRLFMADHDTRAWTGLDLHDAFAKSAHDNTAVLEILQLVCVRREDAGEEGPLADRPNVELSILRYQPSSAETWVWANLEPSLRSMDLALLDGDWPRGLFIDHVLRAWEGGPHELDRALHHLQAFHERWLELDGQGRALDRGSFADCFGVQGEQSVLGFMFEQRQSLIERERVAADLAALRSIRAYVSQVLSQTSGMKDALLGLIKTGGKWLIFASYQRSAEGLYRQLVEELGSTMGVGLVTGSGGHATGLGRAKMEEVVQRFAPRAHHLDLPPHHELQILVTTDCLSEGVNLQDCSQMVFLDLPWTPHAVEQRIGRLVRPGSAARTVHVYLPRPKGWHDTLGMRRRIQEKASQAEGTSMGFRTLRQSQRQSSPLETLTRMDALRPAHSGQPFHAEAYGPHAQHWLLVQVTTNNFRRYRLIDLDDVGAGLETLLPRIVEHLDHPLDVMVGSQAADEAIRACEDLWNELQAAAFAPVQVDSAQVEAWHCIENDERSTDEWSALRQRIFRPLTRGQLSALQRLVSQGDGKRLAQEVLRWDGFSPEVQVELIASLRITPEATKASARPIHAYADETPTDLPQPHC